MQLATRLGACVVALTLLAWPSLADAHIVVTNNVVEFVRDGARHDDIYVHNSGEDRQYVLVEPREVLDAGTPKERRVERPDPAELGLLVTPSRMVLEPGQRQLVRVVRLAEPPTSVRVYRISIRPVVGEVTSDQNAVKVLVGYEALVVVRPDRAEAKLFATREGDVLSFRNDGNTNALLVGGEQCDEAGGECVRVATKRLYPKTSWRVELPHSTAAEFIVVDQAGQANRRFERP